MPKLTKHEISIAKALARGWMKAVFRKGDPENNTVILQADFDVARSVVQDNRKRPCQVVEYASRILKRAVDRRQAELIMPA